MGHTVQPKSPGTGLSETWCCKQRPFVNRHEFHSSPSENDASLQNDPSDTPSSRQKTFRQKSASPIVAPP